jgi:hypothetical protein
MGLREKHFAFIEATSKNNHSVDVFEATAMSRAVAWSALAISNAKYRKEPPLFGLW